MEDNTALDKYRRVTHVEEFYDIIGITPMKRNCYMAGTRRRSIRYGVLFPTCLVTEYEWLSSVAEFVSRDSKKRGRKICIFVPIMSAPAINSSSKANYCKWIFASKQNIPTSCCNPFVKSDSLYVW